MAFGTILGQSHVIPPVLYPQIIVTTNPNIQVTASYNGTVVSAMSDTGGTAVLDVPGYGEWVITVVNRSETVIIDAVKQYNISIIPYVLLSAKNDGDTVYIGSVPYWVAKHDYESNLNGSGRILLLCQQENSYVWDDYSNNYQTSSINRQLTTSFYSGIELNIRNIIPDTTFPILYPNSSTQTNYTAKFFILTVEEYGAPPNTYTTTVGTMIPNGTNYIPKAGYYWTRLSANSAIPGSSKGVNVVYFNQLTKRYESSYMDATNSFPCQPCFTLPGNCYLDESNKIYPPA